jgi:hypothetical protein
MKDYLERNIYPERLKNNFVYKHIPPINETSIPDIQYEEKENHSYYLDIKNKLNTIDNLIYSLNNVVDNSHETCPICICQINDTNIIIPSCGHKTCIGCFVSNLAHNKHTGNLCSICRNSIVN